MNDDDLQLHQYQDDLDTDPNRTDKITEENTDDLLDTAGIPRDELAREFKKIKINEQDSGGDYIAESTREDLEDRDEELGGRTND